MVGIPPVTNTDNEDVAWALQTAEALWKRNERVDAIVWLRRAAQAAGDAQDDDRALALAREAAELSDWIAKNPFAPEGAAPSQTPSHDAASSGVDDLLGAMPDIPIEVGQGVSMSAMTEPHAFMPGGPIPPARPVPPPRPVTPVPPRPASAVPPPRPVTPVPPPGEEPALPSFPMPRTPVPPPPPSVRTPPAAPASEASVAVFQSVASDQPVENVLSAAEKHAGMLDPWSPPPEEELAPRPISHAPALDDGDDEDVVTSARLEVPPAEPAVVMTAPVPAAAPPPLRKKPPAPPPPAPLDSGVVSSLSDQSATAVIREAPDPPTMEVPVPVIPPAAIPPGARFPPEQTLVSAGVVKEDKGGAETPAFDLSTVEALGDLPDDARAELQKNATVHRLAREEELMGFALAYVISGEVDVAAQIVDAPAERLRAGALLKAKGTVAESVPLRLIAATDGAVVATWEAEQIEPAFKACPWVEDDLRASANRMQALVGITLGSIADRLDASLRAQVTAKLELREVGEGEVIIEQGQPIREMAIVGQGTIELLSGDEVVGRVTVGEFLFPAEILGGGTASSTARAGKGGALLLASDRAIAQELMVTCPPLLEIFAGM